MSRAKTWPLVLPRQLSKHSNFVPGLLGLHTARKSLRRAPGDVRGHGLPSRACPQLPFGPTQPAVMSASPFPSSSSSSLLSQHGAGPSFACGPGDWAILMLASVRAIRVVCAPRTTPACIESWVKALHARKVPAEGKRWGLSRAKHAV